MSPFYSKVHHHPGNRPYNLRDAANEGALIVVHCRGCRRTVNYMASDLVTLINGDQPAKQPPYPCARCATSDRLKITIDYPQPGDYGALEIRRPAGRKIMLLWRWAKLGDE